MTVILLLYYSQSIFQKGVHKLPLLTLTTLHPYQYNSHFVDAEIKTQIKGLI